MTEETVEDRSGRYLVPVARLNLPDEPDVIHLSVYQWLPEVQGWGTRVAICGASAQPGPLLKATATCPGCLGYRARYERMLAPGYQPEDDNPDVLRERLAAAWEEIAELKRERDVLRRVLARISTTVAGVAMFAFDRKDDRRTLLRTKWRTAERVLAYTSGPENGCDCDRTALRRSWHAGHLITCEQHVGQQGRHRHFGRKS